MFMQLSALKFMETKFAQFPKAKDPMESTFFPMVTDVSPLQPI